MLEFELEEGMILRDVFNLDFIENVKDITVFPLQREMAIGILCHELRSSNLTFFEAIIDPKSNVDDPELLGTQKTRNSKDDIEYDTDTECAVEHPLDTNGWLNIYTRWIVNVPSIEQLKILKTHNFHMRVSKNLVFTKYGLLDLRNGQIELNYFEVDGYVD